MEDRPPRGGQAISSRTPRLSPVTPFGPIPTAAGRAHSMMKTVPGLQPAGHFMHYRPDTSVRG